MLAPCSLTLVCCLLAWGETPSALHVVFPLRTEATHNVAVPNWWQVGNAQQYIVILPQQATLEVQADVEDALGPHGELLTYLPHNSFLFVADAPTAAVLPKHIPGAVVHPFLSLYKFLPEVRVCCMGVW